MSVVKVSLTHSASRMRVPEKRYGLAQTIESIKENVFTHFATPPEYMQLQLIDDRGITIEKNMANDKQLGYYQCRDEFVIHVVDLQPSAKVENFDDVSQVEKYEISEEAYSKREDNARAFRQRMIAQQRAEAEREGIELPKELDDDSYKEKAETIHVGDRCLCRPGDRLGSVRFVGRVASLKPGYWVGVEFDEPVGKGDGTVKGTRVFQCQPNYGGFLRPDQVDVGDFPPEVF
ncbi:tubulin-specific chaperone, putative [Trypanosoma equiperdum]|uniref:Tubulin-specific chaperone, putative n=3 Tax=Trypanozoon TaxID=39700 RepID=Q388K4_TRYB2|nr:tubulin-specific chaperone, putative [Trypanosoma brucei brucei TREU927]EAN78766.1 tubulin-specific chaperone, putative [Trypanosoma brucei brucei TREU927]SCU65994.1 tubulin-specific chaperone, putative [Trypanosoma equiperdum]